MESVFPVLFFISQYRGLLNLKLLFYRSQILNTVEKKLDSLILTHYLVGMQRSAYKELCITSGRDCLFR